MLSRARLAGSTSDTVEHQSSTVVVHAFHFDPVLEEVGDSHEQEMNLLSNQVL